MKISQIWGNLSCMANDYTVRVSKEARAEINRKARLNQQSSREYLDELLGIKEKPKIVEMPTTPTGHPNVTPLPLVSTYDANTSMKIVDGKVVYETVSN